MSSNEVIVDEQALITVLDGIKHYGINYREMLEKAIRKIKLNSEEWNDEDFNSLLSAMNSFFLDIEKNEQLANNLMSLINKKISLIHELHNIKMN